MLLSRDISAGAGAVEGSGRHSESLKVSRDQVSLRHRVSQVRILLGAPKQSCPDLDQENHGRGPSCFWPCGTGSHRHEGGPGLAEDGSNHFAVRDEQLLEEALVG